MTTESRISNIRKSLKKAFSADSDIAAIYLFGSISRGEQNPLSDIDLGFLFSNTVGESAYFDRRLQLIGQCQSLLHFSPVEVVILNNVSLVLGHRIIARGEILFDADPEYRVQFETRLISRYLDFLPILRVQQQSLYKRILEEPALG